MDRGLPSERDIRQVQNAAREVARIEEQLRLADVQSHIYTIQDALEERRRLERDLRAADVLREVQAAEQLRRTLGFGQLDVQRAAQDALDQHQRVREMVGDDALEAAAAAADQRARASLDATRVAEISRQLDADYLARTLRQAQELLSDTNVADFLVHADAEAIIREAEEAIAAYPPSQPGEVAVGPPEWLRRLSRENLLALVKVLELYVESTLAVAFVVSAFTDANATEAEVQAVLGVLKVALLCVRHELEKGEDDG